MKSNPVRDQDRAFDTYDQFDRFGYVMFPQQIAIYNQLADRLAGKIIMEAGCGNGVGSAVLDRKVIKLYATDVSSRNVEFARCLYPWIDFSVWDILQPPPRRTGTVVCVEAIEHVADVQMGIANLIASTYRELWISTPNGVGKSQPPDNPFHIQEFLPQEMLAMLQHPRVRSVEILHWENFEPLQSDTRVDPLVYRVEMEGA